MSNRSAEGSGPAAGSYRLRVFRVEPGVTVVARTLSIEVGGLFTHFAQARSWYCPPEGCQRPWHKLGRFWKGYAAVELYDGVKGLWAPSVLEVTENLELDLRGIYRRGQLWELSRLPQTTRRKLPVQGRLLEERNPADFPPAFDIVPVLKHLFHADAIDLSARNPLPPRTVVTYSQGEPPPGAELPQTEDGKSFAERWREARQKNGFVDKPSTNGKYS